MEPSQTEQPLVIAHRGAGNPENSCLAFRNAISAEYEGVEFDVHKTSDDILVIHHDKRIGGKFFGPKIENLTYRQVKAYDIGQGETIPTLEEALSILQGNTILDIEVKPDHTGKMVLERLLALGLNPSPKWWISSFHEKVLKDIYESNPKVETGFLSIRSSDKSLQTAIKLGCSWIHPYHRFLSLDQVKKAHRGNIKVGPWTVNQNTQVKKMVELGVDAIITDLPKQAMELRHQHAKTR